eukprot:gene39210-48428_t
MGAKKVDLYFSPPLKKGVAYEDVSVYPLVRDQVVLRLRNKYYKWSEVEGPLTIVGVDTGGGPVKLNGDDGVKIGDVVENALPYRVTVDQLIYNDETNLIISGTGFNHIGNTLRFSNGISGNNVNYTTLSTTTTEISLRIAPGSFWRKSSDNLPGVLTLLAVNSGEGFVAVGPNNAGKGRDVAMVFERPTAFYDYNKLFRTHSHELHIKGRGFVSADSGHKTLLKFAPPLVLDTDYTIRVVDRTDIEVTLVDDRAWRADAGPLQLVAINTRGDEAGWVLLPGDGVHVAEVLDDVDADVTGGVDVFPMGVKVYQSALNQKLQLSGTGFKEGISFTFEPDMKVGTDYDLEIGSKNMITLRLKAGKKWRNDAGFIIAKNESQSKLVTISGAGFTNVADTIVMICPISIPYKFFGVPNQYVLLSVSKDVILVQRNYYMYSWLPNMSLKDKGDAEKIALQISSINTGAGEVTFPEPVTVGYIVKDRADAYCDDSCDYALDG